MGALCARQRACNLSSSRSVRATRSGTSSGQVLFKRPASARLTRRIEAADHGSAAYRNGEAPVRAAPDEERIGLRRMQRGEEHRVHADQRRVQRRDRRLCTGERVFRHPVGPRRDPEMPLGTDHPRQCVGQHGMDMGGIEGL